MKNVKDKEELEEIKLFDLLKLEENELISFEQAISEIEKTK